MSDNEITTIITPVRKTPVERVTERLMRDDPDTLLTEEDLKDIVGQAIQKVFFEPTRESSHGSYSGYGKTGKSTLEKYVEKHLDVKIQGYAQTELNRYLAENSQSLEAMVRKEVQRIPDILLTRGLNFLTNQIMTGLLGDVMSTAFNTASSRHYNNPQEQDLASSIMNALGAAVHDTRDTNEFNNLAGDPINLFNIDQRLLAEFMKENQKEFAKFTASQEKRYAEGEGVLSEVAGYKERLAETSSIASTFKYRISNLQSELDTAKRQNEILEERIAKLEELLAPQESTDSD